MAPQKDKCDPKVGKWKRKWDTNIHLPYGWSETNGVEKLSSFGCVRNLAKEKRRKDKMKLRGGTSS